MLGRNASMTDETPKRILCLGCASIDVVTPTSDEYIRCPHCNRTQKVAYYKKEKKGQILSWKSTPIPLKSIFNFKYICYLPRNIDRLILVNRMGYQE